MIPILGIRTPSILGIRTPLILGIRTPFDLAPFWKASSCAGHVPGPASNLVTFLKLTAQSESVQKLGSEVGGVVHSTPHLSSQMML